MSAHHYLNIWYNETPDLVYEDIKGFNNSHIDNYGYHDCVTNSDYNDNVNWMLLNDFLEERYGSHTDILNLKLFYMELADSDYKVLHKNNMMWVHNELFNLNSYRGPEPVLGTIPVSTHIPFVPTSPTDNIVPFEKVITKDEMDKNKDNNIDSIISDSFSDMVTVISKLEQDVISSGYMTDVENTQPKKKNSNMITPKTPLKTPRTQHYHRYELLDVRSNIFQNPIIV